MRHFLEVDDLAADELGDILDRAERPAPPARLARQGVALLFEKPSLRTRHSAEMAVVQLGGHPVTVRGDEIGAGAREPLGDIARVLAGYHALLGARVFHHDHVEALAAPDALPVVNLLSDRSHPCQALADLLTMRQEFGVLAGRVVAWVGDFTNVARSLAIGAALSGMTVRVASPVGYGPSEADRDRVVLAGGALDITDRPHEAVAGAHAVHTDVWTSMGQEADTEMRRRAFEGFTVDDEVMGAATPGAIFMHCLPVHRGEEVTASVVDGADSRVFAQAANRLPTFRALLWWLVDQSAPAR